jgi:hypothetical protein
MRAAARKAEEFNLVFQITELAGLKYGRSRDEMATSR